MNRKGQKILNCEKVSFDVLPPKTYPGYVLGGLGRGYCPPNARGAALLYTYAHTTVRMYMAWMNYGTNAHSCIAPAIIHVALHGTSANTELVADIEVEVSFCLSNNTD